MLRSEAPLRRVATADVRVPMEFKVRGGRKEIVLPADAEAQPKALPNRLLVLALARAYRWQRMLDAREVASLDELAVRYDVDRSYVSPIINLSALAPDIVGAVLAGNEADGLSLAKLREALPYRRDEQTEMLGFPGT